MLFNTLANLRVLIGTDRPGAAMLDPHDCLPARHAQRIAQHQHRWRWSLSACATTWS